MKEVDILSRSWRDKPARPEEDGGVRLLAESRQPISCEAAPEAASTKAHKHKRREIAGEEDLLSASEKIRAAAVSPEWVLQGQGVFGKNCYRGEVITGAVHSWTSSKKS